MSSTLPSVRPLAALSGASISKRPHPRPLDIAVPDPNVEKDTHAFLGPEKDADDPTTSLTTTDLDSHHLSNPQSLSRLFAAGEAITPGALSRGTSHWRSFSGTTRAMSDTTTLTGHIFYRGFIDGRHSDITICAFKNEYKLHKLVLDRVPFFSSAFSGAWAESSAREMTLHPEEIDPHITRSAFELALRRIYGAPANFQEDQEAIGLFATACWLEMSDLVDSSVDCLLRQMHPSRLDVLIKLVTNNYYGKAGDRILSSAKAMLCREGWEMPYKYWDGIPAEIVREVIGGDPFYVPGEWERWFLALKLLNRRLKAKAVETGLVSPKGVFIHSKPSTLKFFAVRFDTTYRQDAGLAGARGLGHRDDAWVSLYTSPEIAPILVLLDEGIHYVHLRFEQLQQIRNQRDILGVPVLPESVISNALWMSMELRQRILNAHENDLELGLSEAAEDYDEDSSVPPPLRSAHKGKQREDPEEEPNEIESGSWDGNAKPRKFWIPSSDISCVMGGTREACLGVSTTNGNEWATQTHRLSASLEPSDLTWAADFTGSAADISGPITRNVTSQAAPRFSYYPPFRFSAEFPNPRTLKEKKRVYSQTVWYAGSMWNLYIQRVNTPKSQQLGIYLHRAKDKDPSDDPLAQFIPATVDDRIGQLEREMLLRKSERRNRHWRNSSNSDAIISSGEHDEDSAGSGVEYDGGSNGHMFSAHGGDTTYNNPTTASDSILWKSKSPPAAAGLSAKTPSTTTTIAAATASSMLFLPSDSDDQEAQHRGKPSNSHHHHRISVASSRVPAIPPYTDARPTIKTYFKIYSPSRGGRMLSIYESAPDRFNFSQSWGWKSSQMVLDDGLDGVKMSSSAVGANLGAAPPATVAGAGGGASSSSSGKDGKLRYMVVIGNI